MLTAEFIPTAPAGRILTGLIGRGIQASRSPQMHEGEAGAQGLGLEYRLFDLAADGRDERDLPELLTALASQGYAGVNVTHPYKQAIIPLLDSLSEQAARLGAVNTVSFAGGRRTGYNTDVTGFAASFRRGLPGAAVGNVVQMGAGGAGAATAHAMADLGVGRLILFDSNRGRAETLAAALGRDRAAVGEDLPAAVAAADGIINTTPMGMADHPGTAIPAALLRPALWVADIVYFPLETELLRDAAAAGCRVLDGSGMAVFQAADAFTIFTGRPANPDRMRNYFAEE